ncbi:MAG: reverse transcriptase domain-containing protein [Alphaproteobacteria bacterium]
MSKSPIAKQARDIRRLEAAWRVIQSNGQRSDSKKTRDEVDEFRQVAGTGLRQIKKQLLKNCFKFPAALGIPIDRGRTKSRRPIVKSPVPSRIVQRSIHDSLLNIPAIQGFVENPNSFGGVTRRDSDGRAAVPAAIAESVREIKSGAAYFIRSDIASFFAMIPKPVVLKLINDHVTDTLSRNLVRDAVYIELSNMAKLRKQGFDSLFPIEDIGVAQGNCLSPLLGNILLNEFDRVMSDGVCRCLRYIDDFIILGPDKKAVWQRFREVIEYLRKYDMIVYNPKTDTEKADHGDVRAGFDFLGVNLKGGLVRPARRSRRRLIRRVKEILDESADAMVKSAFEPINRKHSLTRTLTTISGIARGWAEQYSYCNERNVLQTLDREIDKMLRSYLGRYSDVRLSTANDHVRRRLLGVSLLTDSHGEMIQWDSNSV